MNNQDLFKQTLAGIGEVYGKEITPALAKIYWTALAEFSDEQVMRSFEQAISTLKWFPKPAEIREMIVGKSEERAHEAWGLVLEDLRRGVGHPSRNQRSSQKCCGDEANEIIGTLGGFSRLAEMTSRDLDFVKKDFVSMYAMKSDRGEIKALPPAEMRKAIGHG